MRFTIEKITCNNYGSYSVNLFLSCFHSNYFYVKKRLVIFWSAQFKTFDSPIVVSLNDRLALTRSLVSDVRETGVSTCNV